MAPSTLHRLLLIRWRSNIGLSSISALRGGGIQKHYISNKTGILSLMQICAVTFGTEGIRYNTILPGTVNSQMNATSLAQEKAEKEGYGREDAPWTNRRA